jgi:hypothetical protein
LTVRGLRGGGVEFVAVSAAFSALAAAVTYPLIFHPATLARTMSADGQFSIWNVAWVAHALLTSPRHVLDANIFYPHQRALLYSESNLFAGALATPVYWLTHSPYAAHNVVLVLSFALSGVATYYLVRYLAGDRRAALVAAVLFASAPYPLAHLQQFQLLMTAGIPIAMLSFHRLADRPVASRAIVLGLAMGAEAYACGYYAIFIMLMVGVATFVIAATRRLWRSASYWRAIAIAAAVAIAVVVPLGFAYWSSQRETGFVRNLSEARQFSADWRAYLASAAYLHRWMLPLLGHWKEVLFPGFTATVVGGIGAVAAWRSPPLRREAVLLYALLGLLAGWVSLGPGAGLFSVLYATVPGFTFLRAAARFGLIVSFSLAILAGFGVEALVSRSSRSRLMFAVLLGAAVLESMEPVTFDRVRPVPAGYRVLANLPRGGLIELPVYSRTVAFMRARYMLASTAHWQPLVNAYSDYTPPDFVATEGLLGTFPSAESFELLKRDGVRYAIFHVKEFKGEQYPALVDRIQRFPNYLSRVYADDQMWLYEITGYP